MNDLELEIFRAGDYGPRGRWSEADLDRLAAAYDPALHEAPVTLDHAQTGPALGWVASVSRRGDRLVARLRGLSQGLLTLLRDGAFKKRSVEIYRALPETGAPYLKALSFLGAAAPAVKGLRDVLFSDVEPLAQLESPTADFTAFDLDVAVGRLSEPTSSPATPLQAASVAPGESSTPHSAASGSADFQPGSSPHDVEAPSPALAFADIIEPLRRSGRFLPAWEERGLRRFFDALADASAFAVRPGETVTPQRWIADFLAALPPAIPMGEAAPPRTQPSELNGMISSVDRAAPASLELHRRVLMLRDSRPHLSYAEALREVARH